MDNTETHEYAHKEGLMFVTVLSARREKQNGHVLPGGKVTPRVRVSSYRENHHDKATTFLVIRKRQYSRMGAFLWQEYGPARPWTEDSRDYGNRRAGADGGDVSWNSATGKQLDTIAEDTLARFVSDFPDWTRESVRLLLISELDTAHGKHLAALAEAEKRGNEELAAYDALRSFDAPSIRQWHDAIAEHASVK